MTPEHELQNSLKKRLAKTWKSLNNYPQKVLQTQKFKVFEILLCAVRKTICPPNCTFVNLSPVTYEGGKALVGKSATFQERVFAYELYHQLRVIWDRNPLLLKDAIVQSEVSKRYQRVLNFGFIPDLLFHLPKPNHNLAVVEIKLARRSLKSIRDDLKKLVRFMTCADLRYEKAIQILIGDLENCRRRAKKLCVENGKTLIHFIFVDIAAEKVDTSEIYF